MYSRGRKDDYVTYRALQEVECCIIENDVHLLTADVVPDGGGGSDISFELTDGSIIGPFNIPGGSQTLSLVGYDLSISGGNTVDLSGINYWQELAGNLTYVSGSVGVGTIAFVPSHDFHVQGDTQLEGDLYDVDGLYTVGHVLTATVGGVRWQSPVLGVDTFDIGADSGANQTVVASDLADFVGSGGIATTVSKAATTITVDIALSDTAVTPGTYGSTSNAVQLTVDQQGRITAISNQAIDHSSIVNLSSDDHTQYALLAGRATGQTLIGGNGASESLILRSTSNATKGDVVIEGAVFADESDTTKRVDVDASAITTATTRTWTAPDRDLDFSVGGTFAEFSHTHPGILSWSEITLVSASMSVNSGYITNNASRVDLTLPVASAQGDTIVITGKGAGGWRISQGAGQQIHFGDQSTTVGATGRVDSDYFRDSVTLVCITNNNEWNIYASQGANIVII